MNRVCKYSFPPDTTGPLSRVYTHLPTTASNHHFRLYEAVCMLNVEVLNLYVHIYYQFIVRFPIW